MRFLLIPPLTIENFNIHTSFPLIHHISIFLRLTFQSFVQFTFLSRRCFCQNLGKVSQICALIDNPARKHVHLPPQAELISLTLILQGKKFNQLLSQ